MAPAYTATADSASVMDETVSVMAEANDAITDWRSAGCRFSLIDVTNAVTTLSESADEIASDIAVAKAVTTDWESARLKASVTALAKVWDTDWESATVNASDIALAKV